MKQPLSILRPFFAVVAAAGSVFLASAILILLRHQLSSSVVALLFLIPVVLSAAIWGHLAGISASILSFFIFLYYFVPPYNTFRVTHLQDFLVMVVFLSVAFLFSSLMARIQSNLAQVQAREREAVQLYDLSVEMTGKNEAVEIANALAKALFTVFNPSLVEVQVQQPDKVVTVRVPESGEQPLSKRPSLQIPLSSPRGLLGEIRLWNIPKKVSPEETRFLETFASQGALALDRAGLTVTETRARVLEESDRLKTAILSSVSHELRTPLATIQAAATSLFNPAVELEADARVELQSLLLEETDRMIQLVGNLLNMSRIEAGALKLQRQWNSFAEIVDTSVRQLQRVSKNHTLEVDVSEDLPLVAVDSVLMEQVIINLVGNSLKFSPPHSTIRIHAAADEQTLQVTVSNSGPAIPEEYLEHVFEKFYPIPRLDVTQSTGLGLSICKGIVEAHGGKIWAANLPVGVAFNFTLPLAWAGVRPILPIEEGEGV